MGMIDQNHFVANLRVGETDPARKTRFVRVFLKLCDARSP